MHRTPRAIEMTARRIQTLRKTGHAHKYDYGHALVLSGGPGSTGAARLAARGALRVGAGLVTLGVPPAAQLEVAIHSTAVMLARVMDAAALDSLLEDKRFNALCLGPGMGVARAEDLLAKALTTSGHATVLDADALTALAQDGALFALLHDRCVLTPHEGEFRRLFPDLMDELRGGAGDLERRIDATCKAAMRTGATILLKGADTVIAAPDGRCSLHAAGAGRAAPWLATAGAGDVLAGFITGLLARNFAPLDAAETAVWLHAEAARQHGPGLIAEDLPDALPQVFAAIGL
ncbi:NAD(P)H-hydrate dehydratase [Roseovarius arcticus]|uniref:NAD(P)H-hydrate dehydratase n=1 Tax=Roseovarius arcticus TaxID=2547404 RepID=UPI00319E0756